MVEPLLETRPRTKHLTPEVVQRCSRRMPRACVRGGCQFSNPQVLGPGPLNPLHGAAVLTIGPPAPCKPCVEGVKPAALKPEPLTLLHAAAVLTMEPPASCILCVEGVDLAALDAADEGVTAEEYLESLLEEAGELLQFHLLRGIYVAVAHFPSVEDAQKVGLALEALRSCCCMLVYLPDGIGKEGWGIRAWGSGVTSGHAGALAGWQRGGGLRRGLGPGGTDGHQVRCLPGEVRGWLDVGLTVAWCACMLALRSGCLGQCTVAKAQKEGPTAHAAASCTGR